VPSKSKAATMRAFERAEAVGSTAKVIGALIKESKKSNRSEWL